MTQLPDNQFKTPRSSYTFFPDKGKRDGEREEIERSDVLKVMNLMISNKGIAGHYLYELWRTNRDEDLFATFECSAVTSFYYFTNKPMSFNPFFKRDQLNYLIKKAVMESALFLEDQSPGSEYIEHQKEFLKFCCEMFVRTNYFMKLTDSLTSEQLVEVKNHYNITLYSMSRDPELGEVALPILEKYFLY